MLRFRTSWLLGLAMGCAPTRPVDGHVERIPAGPTITPRAEGADALVASPKSSPVPSPASIRGIVTDAETGKPIAGAQVEVVYAAWGQTWEQTTSNADGGFEFRALRPVGLYLLTCTSAGFDPTRINVDVAESDSAAVRCSMRSP